MSAGADADVMAIGCIILGLSFIVMIVGVRLVGSGQGSAFWPIFYTLLLATGMAIWAFNKPLKRAIGKDV